MPACAASRSTTARFDQPTVDAMAAIARELGLVMTGGTDYHGDLGPYAETHARSGCRPRSATRS